jgi:hypothetical protein
MMLASERDALEQPRDNGQVIYVPPGHQFATWPASDTRIPDYIRTLAPTGINENTD